MAALPEISAGLLRAGLAPDTAVATVQDGHTPAQRIVTGTLENIADVASWQRR